MKEKLLFLFLIFIVIHSSCKKKNSSSDEEQAPYDKAAMLANLADQRILPAYNQFLSSLDSLLLSSQHFTATPQLQNLLNLRAKFKTAWMSYQSISPFEFGPAEAVMVRMNFNVFPTDTVQINSNIQSGNYNLDAAANLDAKGFPALDFLLYGNNVADTIVVKMFLNQSSRKKYLMDVIQNMKDKMNIVVQNWNNGYLGTFKNSLASDIGSSIGNLVNQLNYELDYLKNAKIGIPLGKKTLGYPVPGAVEGFFMKESVPMALATLDAIEDIYMGRSFSGHNGPGFDDYLNHLKAMHTQGTLDQTIQQQFAVARAKLQALTDPLSQQVSLQPQPVDQAWTELVKLLVLLKTDMPSQLGVQITYQDSDGD